MTPSAKEISNLSMQDFLKLNELDIAHPDMRKQYDRIHPGFAEYFIQALKIYVQKGK